MGTVFKPGTGKGPVILLDKDISTPPTLKLKDGTVLTAKRAGQGAPGSYHTNEDGSQYQWVFPPEAIQSDEAVLTADGKSQTIKNTTSSWRGDIGTLQESSKGSVGSNGLGINGGSNFTGPFAPQVNGLGVAPANIASYFPKVKSSPYKSVNAADYQIIDPRKFAEEYGPFQRQELQKNFSQGKDFSMQALDTELQGLKNFAPAAAALKRSEVGQDNVSNQQQRTAQVNAAVPDVVKDLNSVAGDARTYAKGEVPNSVVNAGLTIGDRSAAADASAGSGFGTGSAASRRFSDILSAKDRIGLSQYGENLLGQNATQRENLLLAPTQYSNAGSQINVHPTLSGSQIQIGQASEINGNTIINAATAFTNTSQQSQFSTNLEQEIRKFNASNKLQNEQFNTTNANNFALSFFGWLDSYTKSLAGAAQTNINSSVALDQQQKAIQAALDAKKETQNNNDAGTNSRRLVEEAAILGLGGAVAANKIPVVHKFLGSLGF